MRKSVMRSLDGLALVLLVLAILDVFVFRYSVPEIYSGIPFVYWSHVDQAPRAPWMLLAIALFSGWLFLHRAWTPLGWLRWPAALMLVSAACLFTIAAPTAAIPQVAHHLQQESLGTYQYRIFYQFDDSSSLGCDVVLVRCDTLGVVCRFVQQWDRTPCLGQFEPIRLTKNNTHLIIAIDNETIVLEE